ARSSEPSETPVPSAFSPPRTSRQRLKSSCRSTIGNLLTEQLHHERHHPSGSVVIEGQITLGECGRGHSPAFRLLADLAALRRLESGEGPAQEGEHLDEGLGTERANPCVNSVPQHRVVDENQPRVP